MDRWRGKVAVVTGASSGIGADIVKQFVQHGLLVAGLARRVERVEELSKTLVGEPGKLYALKCDVSKPEQIVESFNWIKEHLGHVHILVNNAGLFFNGTIVEGDPNDWKTTLDVNILGLSVCSQEAIKQMREKDIAGHIVHISSIAGHWPLIGSPPIFNVYSPSKFAVTTLTEVMRQELAHFKTKIKVTSVSPGLVNTEIFDMAGMDKDQDFRSWIHLKSEDITNAVLYVLGTPPQVLIQDIIVRPLGSM